MDSQSDPSGLFNTGVCDHSHSRRTLASFVLQLKRLLPRNCILVRGNFLERVPLTDTVNLEGCVHLKNVQVPGRNLHQRYQDACPTGKSVEEAAGDTARETGLPAPGAFAETMRLVRRILDAGRLVSADQGRHPDLVLNGVYLSEDLEEILFFPPDIIRLVNAHLSSEDQALAGYPCSHIQEDHIGFALSSARLLYLLAHGLRGRFPGENQPVVDLRSLVPQCPDQLADLVWKAMRGSPVLPDDLAEALERAIREPDVPVRNRLPLFRRTGVILFKDRAGGFFSRRWRLVAVVAAAALAAFYLLSDALFRDRPDLSGLGPREVVHTYYRAMDRLDLELIDELFYRGAGRELRRELASLYVMQKMRTAYGGDLSSPDMDADVLMLEGLVITPEGNGETPVYRADYRRVLQPGDETVIEDVEETIYLHKKHDRWYITRSVRRSADSSDTR